MIGCPLCGERGCSECDEGYFSIDGCPKRYLGIDFVEAVNLACLSGSIYPVDGGLLDQSHWFLQLKNTIDSECARIESERDRADG